ncbi:ABC transporter ATP-binding protein [Streptomyces sp. MB09-01]|uniref:ABC transporter ATP-binding protein n=1 Tax=Streptomyces sp. MB09-01 TaxID=3028666 RepID=UPI0029B75343|nr:ABC transporter ATP-binding protein [Streptomyces sp. MB09-01]MDX3538474.1 ABC transporter ATP-binding protein [Streptomyces sp. MB09-01]
MSTAPLPASHHDLGRLLEETPRVQEDSTLVEAQGLGRSFGPKPVLSDVSFTLRAGEVTGFGGANGAGKTTAIRLMLGLLRGEGRTLYLGRPLLEWGSPGSVVGAVLGGVAGHPGHRVRAHLRMVAAGSGAHEARVDELLESVGLAGATNLRLAELSLGMAQRVGIAQALLGDPPVLILDEPANGLDPHSLHWLRHFLRDQAAAGKAVLVSSHLLGEMEQLADRVLVLTRGRIAATATMREVVEHAARRRKTTVQAPDLNVLSDVIAAHGGLLEPTGEQDATITGLDRVQIGNLALKAGVPLYWLHEEKPSLEDFYLDVAEEEFKIS